MLYVWFHATRITHTAEGSICARTILEQAVYPVSRKPNWEQPFVPHPPFFSHKHSVHCSVRKLRSSRCHHENPRLFPLTSDHYRPLVERTKSRYNNSRHRRLHNRKRNRHVGVTIYLGLLHIATCTLTCVRVYIYIYIYIYYIHIYVSP